MKEITLDLFIQGYEKGFITEIIVVKNRIYGRIDPASFGLEIEKLPNWFNMKEKIVYAVIPP